MLWGGPPEVVAVREAVAAEPEAVRERVADEMVLLVPADMEAEAEAAAEVTLLTLEERLAMTELAEA